MTAEDLRKIQGGVIGNWTPKEIAIDLKGGASVGDLDLGLDVPKGKLIIGSYMANEADDLANQGTVTATLQLKAGANSLGASATNVSSLKGSGVYNAQSSAIYTTAKTPIKLAVGDYPITAGKLRLGVIYV